METKSKGMHLNGYLNAVTVNMLIGDNQTIRRDLATIEALGYKSCSQIKAMVCNLLFH